jgi:hypothetical protein
VTSREQNLVVALAVLAVVALLTAVAAGVFAIERTQRDHARIVHLERRIHTLCSRRTVTHVAVTPAGRFTTRSARGC